jgi:hypothetical protein
MTTGIVQTRLAAVARNKSPERKCLHCLLVFVNPAALTEEAGQLSEPFCFGLVCRSIKLPQGMTGDSDRGQTGRTG